MEKIKVLDVAAGLPEVWRSTVLGTAGGARVKVLRMGGEGLPPESHAEAEALFVVEGRMELVVGGVDVGVGEGELCVVPAGVVHEVRPGSRGVLLLVEG
ncbi:cupin domain-containing protein [Streptomyces sp. HU2014]|uniref:cupin domain-containing protein n=1 Tax=Streptomyces sp. HU2014 TaxID=2939414 RepID=UPI00200F5E2B|nr:cupin domain-containing protein [Streptomyces sp. HU2014]UQI48339.1 cupin domain-containing protein [Streptomyces sp. HU2014]